MYMLVEIVIHLTIKYMYCLYLQIYCWNIKYNNETSLIQRPWNYVIKFVSDLDRSVIFSRFLHQ